VHATAFGLLSSSALAGLALSPVVSGLIGSVSIRTVFVCDVIVMICIGAGVRRLMNEVGGVAVAPAAEDA
jgi:hypothetical protein